MTPLARSIAAAGAVLLGWLATTTSARVQQTNAAHAPGDPILLLDDGGLALESSTTTP